MPEADECLIASAQPSAATALILVDGYCEQVLWLDHVDLSQIGRPGPQKQPHARSGPRARRALAPTRARSCADRPALPGRASEELFAIAAAERGHLPVWTLPSNVTARTSPRAARSAPGPTRAPLRLALSLQTHGTARSRPVSSRRAASRKSANSSSLARPPSATRIRSARPQSSHGLEQRGAIEHEDPVSPAARRRAARRAPQGGDRAVAAAHARPRGVPLPRRDRASGGITKADKPRKASSRESALRIRDSAGAYTPRVGGRWRG